MRRVITIDYRAKNLYQETSLPQLFKIIEAILVNALSPLSSAASYVTSLQRLYSEGDVGNEVVSSLTTKRPPPLPSRCRVCTHLINSEHNI